MQLFNTIIAKAIKRRIPPIERFMSNPHEVQQEVFNYLIRSAKDTEYGKRHDFATIRSREQFAERVPISEYEDFRHDIERTMKGEANILWPGSTKWFAKSSGTTASKSKFIPVTNESLENCHYKCGKDLIALYYYAHPEARLFTGKGLALGGSSQVNEIGHNSFYGDLSAVIINNLPFWVELHRIPGKDVALHPEWEKKLDQMAKMSIDQDITEISGVPSWTMVLLKRILEMSGKQTIREVWPNIELFVHGGVSFTPYRAGFDELIGKPISYLETYNASEGFFGVQDQFGLGQQGLLLMLDYGIYYEFMPIEEYQQDEPKVIGLEDVKIGKQYSLIISTNGGLWRYMPGDTIEFTSVHPYRVRVTGRLKHYINAFGEELIIDNAEQAVKKASEETGAIVSEYTAGPIFMDDSETGGHEWIIEFEKDPENEMAFGHALDRYLKQLNSDYEAKRYNDYVLKPPTIHTVESGTFYNWMKNRGKLGGQNKVPRLSNDRTYVENLLDFMSAD